MIESNEQNDGNDSSEDIIESFLQIKEVFIDFLLIYLKTNQIISFLDKK